MRRMTSLSLACLLLLTSAVAVCTTPALADDAAPTYNTVQPAGWGLSVGLDSNGSFSQPGDEGWTRDDLDFLWMSNYAPEAKYPIYQVDGSTIGKDAATPGIVMTEDEFAAFFDKMTQELTKGGTIKILRSSRSEDFGGRKWQVFNVEETQDSKTLDYYSFFTRDETGILRLVDVYYDAPEDPNVYSLAATILSSK